MMIGTFPLILGGWIEVLEAGALHKSPSCGSRYCIITARRLLGIYCIIHVPLQYSKRREDLRKKAGSSLAST